LDVGKIIIVEVATLTTVVVISLSLYIFWTIKRGRDFKLLALFMFGALLILIFVCFIQVFAIKILPLKCLII
jgi:heme A synthase